MPPLRFSIPAYPHLGRFSDPNADFDGLDEELAAIAALPPQELPAKAICYIFNSWLPAGSYEEMAAYVPRALELLQEEGQDVWNSEIVMNFLPWCYVEEAALARAPAMRRGVEDAFSQLFDLWSATTACRDDGNGLHPLYSYHMEDLLDWGRFAAEHRKPIPWLTLEYYLPRLTALGSVPHAAWALRLADAESICPTQPVSLPETTRRKAVEMVGSWLEREATPEEAAVWRPCLERHRQALG